MSRKLIGLLRATPGLGFYPLVALLSAGTFVGGALWLLPRFFSLAHEGGIESPLTLIVLGTAASFLAITFLLHWLGAAASFHAAHALRGNHPSIVCGLLAAARRTPSLLLWTGMRPIGGTVAACARYWRFVAGWTKWTGGDLSSLEHAVIIERQQEALERRGLGVQSLATNFMIQAIVLTELGPFSALRQSAALASSPRARSLRWFRWLLRAILWLPVAAFGVGLYVTVGLEDTSGLALLIVFLATLPIVSLLGTIAGTVVYETVT